MKITHTVMSLKSRDNNEAVALQEAKPLVWNTQIVLTPLWATQHLDGIGHASQR